MDVQVLVLPFYHFLLIYNLRPHLKQISSGFDVVVSICHISHLLLDGVIIWQPARDARLPEGVSADAGRENQLVS